MIAPTFAAAEVQDLFSRDGFVVQPFLEPAEVDAARRCRWVLGPAPGDDRQGFYQDTFSDDIDHKTRVDAALTGILGRALDRLLLDHVPIISTFLVAWPGSSGVVAHRDISIVDEAAFRSVMVWCPLVPLGPGRGRLFALPGSHRHAAPIRAHGSTGLQDHRSEVERVDAGYRPIEVAEGDAVVFDQAVLHGSEPCSDSEPRLVVGTALRPAASEMRLATEAADARRRVVPVESDYFVRRRLDDKLGA